MAETGESTSKYLERVVAVLTVSLPFALNLLSKGIEDVWPIPASSTCGTIAYVISKTHRSATIEHAIFYHGRHIFSALTTVSRTSGARKYIKSVFASSFLQLLRDTAVHGHCHDRSPFQDQDNTVFPVYRFNEETSTKNAAFQNCHCYRDAIVLPDSWLLPVTSSVRERERERAALATSDQILYLPFLVGPVIAMSRRLLHLAARVSAGGSVCPYRGR